jgi:hypothetical protein
MASTVAMSLVAAASTSIAAARVAALPTLAPTTAATTTPIIDLPAMPAAAPAPTGWSLSPIQPAAMDEVSRALWWRDTLGVVFGTRGNDDGDGTRLDAVHVGGAWRLPVERGIHLTLRSELQGTRTSVEAWRTGATWSVDLAPNASIGASAWWSVSEDRTIDGTAAIGGEGSAILGFTLRF